MAKPFLSEDFLLQSEPARRLYHDYAKDMPICDYHCHLPAGEIAENRQFENLTQIWLAGDHYKWRLMRANGIEERLITGDASDYEKFVAWAATVPYAIRNPLYHWAHMALKRPFGIEGKLLGPDTAREIYERCSEMLQTAPFRARGIMEQMNVKAVCTTDDPVDSLEYHFRLQREDEFPVTVVPTFRPDKAMAVDSPADFKVWVDKLEQASGITVSGYSGFLEAIRKRHDFFQTAGCRSSDHAVLRPHAESASPQELEATFDTARSGKHVDGEQVNKFKAAMMEEFAVMDAEKGWVMQLHIGAMRNNNTRLFKLLGPDTGFDSIGDFQIGWALSRFLDKLEAREKLPKTVLYTLNPRDNELLASMTGNFQDGSVPGKMQFGSAWWFNDQKDGMERQMNALSNMGLLSRFVGMLTDSRSFLSYPRHEYFRRILCNMVGRDVENGELPGDMDWLGKIVQDICYKNAVDYLGLGLK